MVHDGYSIRDPVLIKFCGNGILQEVMSSGHEMLVQFYSGDNGIITSTPGLGGIKVTLFNLSLSHVNVTFHLSNNSIPARSHFNGFPPKVDKAYEVSFLIGFLDY